MAFECLTGHRRLPARQRRRRAARARDRPAAAASARGGPSCGDGLDELFERALAKDPSERPRERAALRRRRPPPDGARRDDRPAARRRPTGARACSAPRRDDGLGDRRPAPGCCAGSRRAAAPRGSSRSAALCGAARRRRGVARVRRRRRRRRAPRGRRWPTCPGLRYVGADLDGAPGPPARLPRPARRARTSPGCTIVQSALPGATVVVPAERRDPPLGRARRARRADARRPAPARGRRVPGRAVGHRDRRQRRRAVVRRRHRRSSAATCVALRVDARLRGRGPRRRRGRDDRALAPAARRLRPPGRPRPRAPASTTSCCCASGMQPGGERAHRPAGDGLGGRARCRRARSSAGARVRARAAGRSSSRSSSVGERFVLDQLVGGPPASRASTCPGMRPRRAGRPLRGGGVGPGPGRPRPQLRQRGERPRRPAHATSSQRGALRPPPLTCRRARSSPGFRVERLIGRGSRATVYEATQLSLGRRVALKVLDDRALGRARAAAALARAPGRGQPVRQPATASTGRGWRCGSCAAGRSRRAMRRSTTWPPRSPPPTPPGIVHGDVGRAQRARRATGAGVPVGLRARAGRRPPRTTARRSRRWCTAGRAGARRRRRSWPARSPWPRLPASVAASSSRPAAATTRPRPGGPGRARAPVGSDLAPGDVESVDCDGRAAERGVARLHDQPARPRRAARSSCPPTGRSRRGRCAARAGRSRCRCCAAAAAGSRGRPLGRRGRARARACTSRAREPGRRRRRPRGAAR